MPVAMGRCANCEEFKPVFFVEKANAWLCEECKKMKKRLEKLKHKKDKTEEDYAELLALRLLCDEG